MKPDFYSEKIVAARRPYRCTFCRVAIEAKQRHVHISSGSCGEFFSHRAHIECQCAADGQDRGLGESISLQGAASEAGRFHTPDPVGSTPTPATTLEPSVVASVPQCTWPNCSTIPSCACEHKGRVFSI